jgi:hypothetical protein
MDSNFNTVPNTGTFGNAVNKINENFLLAKVAIDGIELSTTKNKGIFTSVSSLETTVPSPNMGDWAGVGTAFPVKLYVCNTAGTWVDSGSTWNGGDINLSDYVTNATFNGLVGATNNINVDKLIPLSQGYYTLSTATAAVSDVNFKKIGVILSFKTMAHKIESWEFIGPSIANFNSVLYWKLIQSDNILSSTLMDKDGNYVDYDDITAANGAYFDYAGNVKTGAAAAITDYIYVYNILKVKYTGYIPVTSQKPSIVFYDKNKKFISSVYAVSNSIINVDIDTPTSAVYMRASFFKTQTYKDFTIYSNINNIDALSKNINYQLSLLQSYQSLSRNFDNTLNFNPQNLILDKSGLTSILHDIGFIGDSLASGEIVYKDQNVLYYKDIYSFSWGQRLCKLCEADGINYSSGGLTTASWLSIFGTSTVNSGWQPSGATALFSAKKHSTYMIALGMNDSNKAVPIGNFDTDVDLLNYNNNANTYIGNYCKIIQMIREKNVHSAIFCITYPSVVSSTEVNGYNSAVRLMVSKFDNCFLCDIYNYLQSINLTKYVYGGHFTTQGYQFLAYVIANLIDIIIRDHMSFFNKFALVNSPYQTSTIDW